jgi:hypothetical protein
VTVTTSTVLNIFYFTLPAFITLRPPLSSPSSYRTIIRSRSHNPSPHYDSPPELIHHDRVSRAPWNPGSVICTKRSGRADSGFGGVIRPITPIICSEILSHPQAVRDLFEPLRMLTPYDEFAGCDAWVSGCAAPLGLFGVFAWGFTRVSNLMIKLNIREWVLILLVSLLFFSFLF